MSSPSILWPWKTEVSFSEDLSSMKVKVCHFGYWGLHQIRRFHESIFYGVKMCFLTFIDDKWWKQQTSKNKFILQSKVPESPSITHPHPICSCSSVFSPELEKWEQKARNATKYWNLQADHSVVNHPKLVQLSQKSEERPLAQKKQEDRTDPIILIRLR